MPQLITSSTSDPATAPPNVGYIWVNTATAALFHSTGTAAAADWRRLDLTTTGNYSGAGSPEGATTAGPGALYLDTSVDPPSLWAKLSGSGNTGWRQLIA